MPMDEEHLYLIKVVAMIGTFAWLLFVTIAYVYGFSTFGPMFILYGFLANLSIIAATCIYAVAMNEIFGSYENA